MFTFQSVIFVTNNERVVYALLYSSVGTAYNALRDDWLPNEQNLTQCSAVIWRPHTNQLHKITDSKRTNSEKKYYTWKFQTANWNEFLRSAFRVTTCWRSYSCVIPTDTWFLHQTNMNGKRSVYNWGRLLIQFIWRCPCKHYYTLLPLFSFYYIFT